MSYIWFAWATPIFYGISSIIAKISSKHHIANLWLFNFIWTVFTFVAIVPFAVIGGVGWPKDWVSMFILSLTNVAAGITYLLCLYRMDVSALAPYYSLRTPLVVLLGVLVFHETLNAVQMALISLVFVASIFVSIDERMSTKSFFNRNLGLVLFTILTSAFFNLSVKYASLYNGFWEVAFWPNLVGLVLLVPTFPFFLSDLRKTKFTQYKGIGLVTLFGTLGLLTSFRALGDNVGISIAIMSIPFSMFFAIVLSFVAPKLLEKHTMKVYSIRLVAAAVMIVAALGLSN